METIIGFIAGYLTGVSQGRDGMERARKSLDAIRTSPELRQLVAEGVGLAQVIVGRAARNGLGGVGQIIANGTAPARDERRAA